MPPSTKKPRVSAPKAPRERKPLTGGDSNSALETFAAIAPGLEPALQAELRELGVDGSIEPGGVAFKCDVDTLCKVHLWSRIAGRFTVVVGRTRAASLEGLAGGVRAMRWRDFVHPNQPITVKVTTGGGGMIFRDSIGKKVELAIRDSLRGPRVIGPRAPREPFPVLVKIDGERATLMADASGDRLHMRGWRLATAKAPLRENLAAAVLRVAGWAPDEALVDPMCGSGTFPIEAASIALGLAPGARGGFAFLRWPCVDARRFEKVQEPARAPDGGLPIHGSDREQGAITAALANAKRAQVDRRVEIQNIDVQKLQPPADSGLLVINPPWGQRIDGDVNRIWRILGSSLKERFRGWRVAILLPNPQALSPLGLPIEQVTTFSSGGTRIGLYGGEIG